MAQDKKTELGIDGFKKLVKATEHNIKVFKDAIQKEEEKKNEYYHLIEDAEQGGPESQKPGAFSVEVLQRGVGECERTIKSIEEAIQKERDTQKEYRHNLEEAERMERKREMVGKGITIEAEYEE